MSLGFLDCATDACNDEGMSYIAGYVDSLDEVALMKSILGLTSCLIQVCCSLSLCVLVICVGSFAAIDCEPRQARKGATVVGTLCAGVWLAGSAAQPLNTY